LKDARFRSGLAERADADVLVRELSRLEQVFAKSAGEGKGSP
jgi:hypothetical protein